MHCIWKSALYHLNRLKEDIDILHNPQGSFQVLSTADLNGRPLTPAGQLYGGIAGLAGLSSRRGASQLDTMILQATLQFNVRRSWT